jgi:tetratricopeptide (TPR) repeat protein
MKKRLPKALQWKGSLGQGTADYGSIFLLGKAGSSVAYHKHSRSICGVVHGAKHWVLYHPFTTPPGGINPSWSQAKWLTHVAPRLKDDDRRLECIQKPGEILYIPDGWFHAVANLQDTVAVTIQNIRPDKTYFESSEFDDLLKRIGSKSMMDQQKRVAKFFMKWMGKTLDPVTGGASQELRALFGSWMLHDTVMHEEQHRQNQGAADQPSTEELEKAVDLFQEIVDEDPHDSQSWASLGKAHALLQNMDEAEDCYKTMLGNNPMMVKAGSDFFQLLLNQDRYEYYL